MRAAALSVLFESAPGVGFERDCLERACGVGVAALLASGFVREVVPATEIVCTDCGAPHMVAVQRCEWRKSHGRFCADGGGWAPVGTEALRRFAFDRLQLVSAISTALEAVRAPDVLIDNACWRLGPTRIAKTEVAVILAREMNDPRRFMEVAGILKRRLSAGRGLILCGAAPPVDLGVFPRGFNAVALDDMIGLDARGGVIADLEAAARALGLARRGRGVHGAPVEHPHLLAYIEARLASGEAHRSDTAEARQLLANPTLWANPSIPPPKVDALRMSIQRLRNRRR